MKKMKIQKLTTRISLFVLSLLLLQFMSCRTETNIDSWSQWRGPERDGISLETNLLKSWPEEGPQLAWSVEGLGDGFSAASIKDQMVYTTGKKDSIEVLTAIDFSGNIIWQQPFGRAMPFGDWPQARSTPTVYKNEVYAVSVFGDVACLNRISGEIIWKIPASEKFSGYGTDWYTESPLVFDDKLIFTPGGTQTTVVALDRLTGETLWQSESIQDTAYFTSPILYKKKRKEVIFTSLLHNDIFVDGRTGEIIQKFEHISGVIPEVIDDRMFFTGEYQTPGSMCSYNDDLTERTLVWKDTAVSYLIGGAVHLQGKIVVAGFARGLFCIDTETGEVLSYFNEINSCTLIVADGMIYSFEKGRGRVSLLSLNGNAVERISSFRIRMGQGAEIAHLAISNGLLFVRRGEVLMAYDVKATADPET